MGRWNESKKNRQMKTIKRDTTKRGVELSYLCSSRRKPSVTYKQNIDRCIIELEDDTGFTFIDLHPDGNCFFHALELYYKLSNPSNQTHDYKKLREIIVQYMTAHYDKYSFEYDVKVKDILDLYHDGAWNNDAGVIAATADALGIQLDVYELQLGTRNNPIKNRIVLHTYPEIENTPRETVTLLRIRQGHYGLLKMVNENIL
jgi:hypothetical protein